MALSHPLNDPAARDYSDTTAAVAGHGRWMEVRCRESALQRHFERCPGLAADVVDCDAGMQLGQDESATILHFEDGQIGDDEVDDAQTSDGQGAFFQDLRAAVPGAVLQYRHHALYSSDKVHRSPGSLDHLAGHHPVRDVASVRYLEGAENREIDVPAVLP